MAIMCNKGSYSSVLCTKLNKAKTEVIDSPAFLKNVKLAGYWNNVKVSTLKKFDKILHKYTLYLIPEMLRCLIMYEIDSLSYQILLSYS